MKILQETYGRLARLLDRIVKFFKTKRETECTDKFVCPKCGGNYFGTSDGGGDFSKAKGHCHDQYGVGCRYTWMRKDDGYYFVPRT